MTSPFHLEAGLEAETRGGRLSTGGDHGVGAQFSLVPSARGTYLSDPLRIEAIYGPRFFTRIRGLGAEEILILHRAGVSSAMTVSPRLLVSIDLDGADGQIDFSNAAASLDSDAAAVGALPDQQVIEFTSGRAQLDARWLPARLWVVESELSAVMFRSRENPAFPRGSTPALRDRRSLIWHNVVELQTSRETTWGADLELGYRSFDADPVFTGVTATGTLARRASRHTNIRAWLGGHGSVRNRAGARYDEPRGLLVGGVAGEYVLPMTPNRRLELNAHAELRPFHDPVFATVDQRVGLRLQSRLSLSSDLTALAATEWLALVRVRKGTLRGGRPGQAEHIVYATGQLSYRVGPPLLAELGIRYASRLRRREASAPLTAGRNELVAFIILTLSVELLGD